MLDKISAIILSPEGLIVGVVFAVLSQIIIESIKLIFGKSKSAILRFATERSKEQKEIRRWRVKRMSGVDFFSWTLNILIFRSLRCPKHIRPIRPNSVSR